MNPDNQSFDLDQIAKQLEELATRLRDLAETPPGEAANENLSSVSMQSETPTSIFD
jgi:hypothetical protein